MKTFTLRRLAETDHSTSGELCDETGAVLCKILERGAHNPDHVRIPAATYIVERKPVGSSHFDHAYSQLIGPGYKGILWLPHVPGRSNIEVHTCNRVEELLGCLATGNAISHDANGDFMIAGGTSKPAYAHIYPILSGAIDADGAELVIQDVPVPAETAAV